MKTPLLISAVLLLAGCDLMGRDRCREIMSRTLALQNLVAQAEGAAKKPDAAAFNAALAKVETTAAEVAAIDDSANEKFRVQSATYARKQILAGLPKTLEALKALNAKVVQTAPAEEIRKAAVTAAQLIDESIGFVKGSNCS